MNYPSLKTACSANNILAVRYHLQRGEQLTSDMWQQMITYNHHHLIQDILHSSQNILGIIRLNYWLCLSCLHGHSELVDLFINHGANLHQRLGFPIRLAVKRGHLGVVKLLLSSSNFNDYNQLLRLASKHHHPEIVKYLLDQSTTNSHLKTDKSHEMRSITEYTYHDLISTIPPFSPRKPLLMHKIKRIIKLLFKHPSQTSWLYHDYQSYLFVRIGPLLKLFAKRERKRRAQIRWRLLWCLVRIRLFCYRVLHHYYQPGNDGYQNCYHHYLTTVTSN